MLTFVVLILVASYAFLSYLSSNKTQLSRSQNVVQILSAAKDALQSYSNVTAATGGAQRPGDLPVPDGFASTEVPKNYDGDTDAGCFDVSKPNGLPMVTDNANTRCLGRLPWKTLGLSYFAPSENDVIGVMPWYAVSANLAQPVCLSYLNSDTVLLNYTGFACYNGVQPTSLPHPWLTVRDAKGNVISDRVAFVVLVPGPPINGQSRPPSPNLAGANQYLDAVTINVASTGCPTPPCTFSNADWDNDFIAGEPSDTFNDRLVYVTIDEHMTKIEARVGQEVKAAMQRFSQNYSLPGKVNYPWLAPFGNPNVASNFKSISGTRVGLIPTHALGKTFVTDFTWSVTNGSIVPNTAIERAKVRNTAALTVIDGTCTWKSSDAKSVDCTGRVIIPAAPPAGPITRMVDITFPPSGTYSVTPTSGTATTMATRRVVRGNGSLATCVSATNQCVTITDYQDKDLSDDATVPDPTPYTQQTKAWVNGGVGSLSVSNIRVYSELPTWYEDNQWNQLVLGAVSEAFAPGGNGTACAPTPGNRCLTSMLDGVVQRTDVPFLVMMSGSPLSSTAAKASAQSRPSANRNDYFDTVKNVDSAGTGLIFDHQSTLSPTFNDQLFF